MNATNRSNAATNGSKWVVLGLVVLSTLALVALGAQAAPSDRSATTGAQPLGTSASSGIAVTFQETGLPAGTSWGVTVQGTTLASIGSELSTNLSAGAYVFTPTNVTGYLHAQASSFVVGLTDVDVSVVYTPVTGAYHVLASAVSSDLLTVEPSVRFNVTSTANVVVLASAGPYLGSSTPALSVNGSTVAWTTANVIPSLLGLESAFTGAYAVDHVHGVFTAQLSVPAGVTPTGALTAVEVAANDTLQFTSAHAAAQVNASLPAGLAAYLYAGAAVNEAISSVGTPLGGGYPTAAGYATSLTYFADVSQGLSAANWTELQSNAAAGGGLGLDAVGETLVGVVAPATPGLYLITGTVSPSNASVLVNGVVADVNASGGFRLSVLPGTYHLSASASGYFPFGENVTVSADTTVRVQLEPVASCTSTVTAGNVTALGCRVVVASVAPSHGLINVTFTAETGGRLLVTVPVGDIPNVTLAEFLSSRVYLDGQPYTNYTLAVNASYVVALAVSGLSSGDPTLTWALAPGTVPVTPPSGGGGSTFLGLPGDLGYYLLAGAVVAVVAGSVVLLARPERSAPPLLPSRETAPYAVDGEPGEAEDQLRDVL